MSRCTSLDTKLFGLHCQACYGLTLVSISTISPKLGNLLVTYQVSHSSLRACHFFKMAGHLVFRRAYSPGENLSKSSSLLRVGRGYKVNMSFLGEGGVNLWFLRGRGKGTSHGKLSCQKVCLHYPFPKVELLLENLVVRKCIDFTPAPMELLMENLVFGRKVSQLYQPALWKVEVLLEKFLWQGHLESHSGVSRLVDLSEIINWNYTF